MGWSRTNDKDNNKLRREGSHQLLLKKAVQIVPLRIFTTIPKPDHLTRENPKFISARKERKYSLYVNKQKVTLDW